MLPAALSEFVVSLIPNFDENKHEVDWNTVLTEGPKAGTTLLWNLASTPTGQALLILYFNYFKSQKKLNWNAALKQGLGKGSTVLWCLAATLEGQKLLCDHFANYFKYQNPDLNATHEGGPDHKGKSVLWWLAVTPEGRKLLSNDGYFVDHFAKQEFRDTAPEQGQNKGISVLWWLVSTPEGRQFLKKLPQVFLSKDVNLNVHPTGQPSFLKRLLDAKDKSLIQWALLCGASPFALDIPPAQQLELQQHTKNMWEKIRVAVRTIYRDLYEADHLKGDIKKLLCMTHLMQNHPELAFVTSPAFYQLIKNETEICLNEPFNIVAAISIRNFQQEKGIALILDRYHRDLFRENIVSALIKYAEKEASFENLLISEKTLRQSIINAIAKTKLEKNEIEKVIRTAFQQWRQLNCANYFTTMQGAGYRCQAAQKIPEENLLALRSARERFFIKEITPLHLPEDLENIVKRKEPDTDFDESGQTKILKNS